MVLNATNIFSRNLEAYLDKTKRRAFNEGGTASSKTFSILQLLIVLSQNSKGRLLTSVVSESVPHLKRGCIRDFKKIMGDMYDDRRYHETDRIYEFKPGVLMEFFPADDDTKLRGGRRDILYINECNNTTVHSFDELDIRTERFTFTDNNPVEPFWMHELKTNEENAYIHSTYQDAKQYLPQSVIDNIESRRDKDPNWWRVYGEGLVGKIQGLVHPKFTILKEWPSHLQQASGAVHGYGIDFGYSNDPTAIVECIALGENLYSRLLAYSTGMTNKDIIDTLDNYGVRRRYDQIWADNNEPKSIDEIYENGFDIKPVAAKSISAGIQKVNQFYQHWCESDLDAIEEQRNYRFVEDKNGKLTNKTIDHSNHALDARRYWVWMAIAEERYHTLHSERRAI